MHLTTLQFLFMLLCYKLYLYYSGPTNKLVTDLVTLPHIISNALDFILQGISCKQRKG